jgi:CRISPR-associated protein Cas8a1/Csx13
MAEEMILRLNAAGMTSLHKAGLAGLYMTLNALDGRGEKIEGLTWSLAPTQINLYWQEATPKAAFERLIMRSFQVDKEGFIRLVGLETESEPRPEQKHHLYTALLNSFLQFGPHRPTGSKRVLSYEVDERRYWLKDFAPIKEFRHQGAATDFIGNRGMFHKSIATAGWLYPGGVQRHVAHATTILGEPLESALALLFAPVGVIYFKVESRRNNRKARLALLIPEIKNLELYADVRRDVAATGVLNLTASSASDAALRMFTLLAAHRVSSEIAGSNGGAIQCRVITFGIVPWNEKQKSRTAARSVYSGALPDFENYRMANAIFKNRWQLVPAERDRNGAERKPERHFIATFCAREMIADNIAEGKAWYHDLTLFMNQRESRERLLFERRELHQMVERAKFEDERERTFIHVCHESWRRRMGKLSEQATPGGSEAKRRISKEAERLRVALMRSKNAETLRETVVDLWARAGSIPALQGDGLLNLLPLFDERHWKKTRDLALLALISYQPQNAEEAAALATTSEENAINTEGEDQ